MRSLSRLVLVAAVLALPACGGDGEDPEDRGNAAPDLTSETSPPAVPLPPETEPGAATGVTPPTTTDTTVAPE